jgi:glycosyltransferase involved in cell wall biosynthesis
MRWQTRRAIERADLVLAVSPAQREDILREVPVRRPERIEIMPNGVRADLFHPGGPRPRDGYVRVLWIGGLVPVKRLDLLLDAFAAAQRERAELRLTLVGEGSLARAVEERIDSLGLRGLARLEASRSRQGVADAMRAHDFLVVSSATESFSLVTIEALACGRPVLSTRCGGPESILVSPKLGELVEGTRDALAQGLLSMAARLGEFDDAAIAEHARREYGQEVLVKRTIAVYERVLGRSR